MDGIKIKYASFWQILFSLIGALSLTLPIREVEGYLPHLSKKEQAPSISARYHLIDLGEIDALPEELSTFANPLKAPPAINNMGDVIANSKKGATFIYSNLQVYSPHLDETLLEFHALNNHGDVLVSLKRCNCILDWAIWPKNLRLCEKRQTIDPLNLQGSDLHLKAINDSRWIAGEMSPDGVYRPIIGTPLKGLKRIGYEEYFEFKGIVRGLNQRGTVLGQTLSGIEHPPFIFDPKYGLFVLHKYRDLLDPPPAGRIDFLDLVLSDDNVVYVTYWINDQLKDAAPSETTVIGSFIWKPMEQTFCQTNTSGMRIASINSAHQFVGRLAGKAVVLDPGFLPTPILDIAKTEDLDGWEILLEATDINDMGQIVGFGKRKGKVHLFRADPLEECDENIQTLGS